MLAELSSYNDSLLTSDYYSCYMTNPNKIILMSFNITQVLVFFPLCMFILYLRLQQLQLNRTAALKVVKSHTDSSTYNMVVMELIGVLGCIVSFIGNCMENLEIVVKGLHLFWFTWYAQICFHSLTSLDRYLAVVHPFTYLSMRSKKGIILRHISICCVWLISFGGVWSLRTGNYINVDICLLLLTTTAIFFCSISVLCVLIRPGPGEQGKEKTDQSKHRAFYVIMVILGTLMLRLTVSLVSTFLGMSTHSAECIMILVSVWISLPSSLVLPLLYLQRSRKLLCCKEIFKCSTP